MTYYRTGDKVRLVRWLDEYGEDTDLPRGFQLGMAGTITEELDEDGVVEVEFLCEEGRMNWTEWYYIRPSEIEPWEPVDPSTLVSAKIKKLWEQSNYYKKVNGIEITYPAVQDGEPERETAGSRLAADLQHAASVSRPQVSAEVGSYDPQLGLLSEPFFPGDWYWNYYQQAIERSQQHQQAQNIQALNGALRQDAGLDYGQASGRAVANSGVQGSLPPNGEWGAWGGHHLGLQFGGFSTVPSLYEIGDSLEGVSSPRIQFPSHRLRAEETSDGGEGE